MTDEQQKIASRIERECDNIRNSMCFARQQADMAAVIAQGLSKKAGDGCWDFSPRFVETMERMLEYMRDVRRSCHHARKAYQILRILRADQILGDSMDKQKEDDDD